MPNEKTVTDFVPHRGALNEQCPTCSAVPGAFCTRDSLDPVMMLVHASRVKRAEFSAKALSRGAEPHPGATREL